MVLILSFAGSVFSLKTGLNAPLLEGMLHGKINWSGLQQILLPTFLYAIFALLVFCGLYYGLAGSVLDDHTMQVLSKLRAALGVDGCVLYGGVVEEVIARWGLMNLIAFFLIFFVEHQSDLIIWTSIIVSGLMLGVGQIPAYIAAGCKANRRFMYVILLISLWPSLVFGYLFWQYGLISCILAHMIFYLGWSRYDPL